jgi:tritrans,polycis-undecaprenyl-diphosphate synthase [geranylgeranyl-diphosphate specific]
MKPKHIAVVLDGNRRYAKKHLLGTLQGHDMGAETVENLIEWASDLNVEILTLYALSIENLSRSKPELEHLFNLFEKWFTKLKNDRRIKEKGIQIKFVGNIRLLPQKLQNLCKEIEEDTKDNENLRMNFCMAYGGKQELIEAFKKVKENNEEITEDNIFKNLWLQEEPELIIRTGDRTRTSNFLPWQSTYSEWIFLKKLWPEFTKQDLIESIEKFETTERNFGK